MSAVCVPPASRIIDRTIAGEYWNTASYALTTLCRHEADGYAELLSRFEQFATSGAVDHPSRPSLDQEREFAQNLAAKNPQTVQAIESVLDQKEQAATSDSLDDSSRGAIKDLLQAAERFESGAAELGLFSEP